MALRIQRNIDKVMIAKDVAITATRGGYYASQLGTGEIAVFTPGGTVADTTTVLLYDNIYIGYTSSNGEFITSGPIPVATVKNYKGKVSVAATEQLDYIGYNGTSGAIEVIDSNLYLTRLWFTGDTNKSFMDNLMKYGVYKSDATATEEEIALGLASNLAANMKAETEYRVKVELVNSGVTTASSGGAFTVVNGSTTVTTVESSGAAGDAGKYNSDAGTLVVGDYIRFGHATTKTYPVYKITAITGAATAACTITLDREYQGTSGSVAAANVGCMLAATAQAGDYGIKLTGVAKTWSLGKYPYSKVMWTTELCDFGTTTVTESVKASRGIGTPEQVAEAEWFAQGNEGGDSFYRTRAGAPAYTARRDSEDAHYYSTLTFSYADVMTSEIGPSVSSPKSLTIFLNEGTSAATGVTATSITDSGTIGFMEVLDAAVAAATAETAQLANV